MLNVQTKKKVILMYFCVFYRVPLDKRDLLDVMVPLAPRLEHHSFDYFAMFSFPQNQPELLTSSSILP